MLSVEFQFMFLKVKGYIFSPLSRKERQTSVTMCSKLSYPAPPGITLSRYTNDLSFCYSMSGLFGVFEREFHSRGKVIT